MTFEEPSRREAAAPGPRPVTSSAPADPAAARAPTALPNGLRTGVEALAGVDLSATRVHRGSPLPRTVDALAYARGSDIHLAPGEERHLPHEAWHVAQQLQGRVRPMTQFKGAAGNDDAALEREADVMGARALRLGNRIVRNPLDPTTAPARRTWARRTWAIQREPVKTNATVDDPNYHDSEHVKVRLLRTGEDVYRIKGSEQTVRWKDGCYWFERGEAVPTIKFDMKAHAANPEFLDFTVGLKEAVKATGDDKSAASDALRLHVLQRFIANALYTADEIARLNYQASPLNFQERGLYIRSQATSFVEALKKQLGIAKPTVQLVKSTDFNTVLGQFLLRFDAVAKTADISAKVRQIADFYSQKGSLEGFDDAHGGLFADVGTGLTATTLPLAEPQIRGLAQDINAWIFRQVAPLVIEQHVEAEYASSPRETRQAIVLELQAYVRDKSLDLPTFLTVVNPRRKAEFEAARVVKVDSWTAEIAAANAPAPALKDFVKYIGAYKAWLNRPAHPAHTAAEGAFVAATGGAIRTTFEPLIKAPSFTEFLAAERQKVQDSTYVDVGPADVKTSGALDDLDRLAASLAAGISDITLVGGTLTLEGQPAMLLDAKTSKKMVKEVTIALNKSGYVPTPAAASRAMLARGASLATIVTDVARLQAPEAKSPLAPKFKAFIDTVTGFDPATYTSVIDTVDQLARTNVAFESFATLIADRRSYVAVQAGAIKRLIDGLQLLAPDAALPAIALRQLEVNLADALANKDDIAAFIRNIQNLHEAVILGIEHAPARAAARVGDDLPLPKDARSPHITDYGLQAFSHAYEAVAAQHGKDELRIDAYSSIYFELLDKFRHTEKRGNITLRNPRDAADFKRLKEKAQASAGVGVEVKGPDLVLIDIHPNDASKAAIEQQQVAELITSIFEGGPPTQRVTVIVDITLNHVAEETVTRLRAAVRTFIDDGRLNLVFIQSLTKFTEMGSDKLSGGMMFHFNVDAHWKAFNEHVAASSAAKADRTAELYFRSLLTYAKDEQVRYIEAIRTNTKYVYDALTKRLPPVSAGHKTIELSVSADPGACYVAFNYVELAARLWPADPDRDLKTEQLGKDILNKGIYALADKLQLPLSLRQSFGFPISNMGDAWVGTRFTIGTETEGMLDDYVRLIAYVRTELQDIAVEGKDDVLRDRVKLADRFTAMSASIASIEDLRRKLDERLEARKGKL